MSTALAAAQLFRAGAPVLVGDDNERTAFIAAAAGTISPEQLGRLQTLGHGAAVLGMSPLVAERLQLPAPAAKTEPGAQLRLLAPIDAAGSADGGWSLHDRALTMRVAADPSSGPGALTSPGHVLAGQVQAGTSGAAAAALELALLAELEPVVALSPVLDRRGGIAPFAAALGEPRLSSLPRAPSDELHSHAAWRRATELAVSCELPLRVGHFRAVAFGQGAGLEAEEEHVTIAFVHGDPATVPDPFVHVHVACRLGDVFGSLLCDCRTELEAAVERIVAAGCGVIVYTQPTTPRFMQCPRERSFAQPSVAGLLRAIGVSVPAALRPAAAATAVQGPGHGDLEVC